MFFTNSHLTRSLCVLSVAKLHLSDGREALYFLLKMAHQCMLSRVRLFVVPSSVALRVHGIIQARILE